MKENTQRANTTHKLDLCMCKAFLYNFHNELSMIPNELQDRLWFMYVCISWQQLQLVTDISHTVTHYMHDLLPRWFPYMTH